MKETSKAEGREPPKHSLDEAKREDESQEGQGDPQIWLAIVLHRSVVRAYPSSVQAWNQRRSTIVKSSGVATQEKRE